MEDVKQNCEKVMIRDPNDLPDFAEMTPEQEAVFWESHEFASDVFEGVFETGDDVDAELDALLGLTPADKR